MPTPRLLPVSVFSGTRNRAAGRETPSSSSFLYLSGPQKLRALSAPSTTGRNEEERDPALAIRSDRPWVSSVSDGTLFLDFDLVLWIVSLSSIQSRRFCGCKWIPELMYSQIDWNHGWDFCVLRVCFLLSFSSFPRSISIILQSGSHAIRLSRMGCVAIIGWSLIKSYPLFVKCVHNLVLGSRWCLGCRMKISYFFPFEVHGITF